MIHLKSVNKIYNGFYALRDVSLHVKPAELVVLRGVSGSGKSTLLSLIGALHRPSSGNITVDGLPVAKLPDLHASHFRRKKIGFVFQSFNLFDALSVERNVALPLVPTGDKALDKKVEKAMRIARIAHKSHSIVRELSGGEKQRCAIARALVNEPKIILCDEPTANLDRENAKAFIESVKELHEMGKTVLIATHDAIFESLEEARIVDIADGRIV